MFTRAYAGVFDGDDRWRGLDAPAGETFDWDADSTYLRRPPYLDGMTTDARARCGDIEGARVLVKLGDSVTTDHVSPAGAIPVHTPAGQYLTALGVERFQLNTYASRRGNHEVMMRGTFANVRLRNQLVPGVEGGSTHNFLTGEVDQRLRRRHGLPSRPTSRWSSSAARTTAAARRATGPPRARPCWECAPSWPSRSSGSIART